MGRFDDSAAAFETAIELDPLAVSNHNELGNTLVAAGRQQEAEARFATALALDSEFVPTIETLGWLKVREGELGEALKIFESLPPNRLSSMAALGFTFAQLGETEKARASLRDLVEASRTRDISAEVQIARVHAGLGEFDEAYRLLSEAIDRRAIPVMLLPSSVRSWGAFRDDPRFQRLIERIRPDLQAA